MHPIRRYRAFAPLLFSLATCLGLSGCGEKEPPPVEVDNIDFEAAQQEATKEYGGGN